MTLEHSRMQSDSNRFSRKEDRKNNMATEGHKSAKRKKPKMMNAAEMDKELADINREMEELEMKMQQEAKSRWVHEWPMKTPKVKWPVRELMVKGQQRLLRRWLRYVESLKPIEEEMVQACEPESGKILGVENEMGLSRDLKRCQEGREEEIPDFQEGNRLRSTEDLTDCHEDSQGISICQVGKGT
jgi:hypothetical protein